MASGSAMVCMGLLVLIACIAHLSLPVIADSGLQKDVGSSDGASVAVVGTAFCDRCLDRQFTKNSALLPGAAVEVECKSNNGAVIARVGGVTDEHGSFRVELPSTIFGQSNDLGLCKATLVNSPLHPRCNIPTNSGYGSPSTPLTLKAKLGKQHVYSVGFLSFRPRTAHASCKKSSKGLVQNTMEAPVLDSESAQQAQSISETVEGDKLLRGRALLQIPGLGPIIAGIFGTPPPPFDPFAFIPPPAFPGTVPGFIPPVTANPPPYIPIPTTPVYSYPPPPAIY